MEYYYKLKLRYRYRAKSMYYEIVSARQYYGKHAKGSVLLLNGYPVFHASTKEVNLFIKLLRHRQRPVK